MADSSSIQVKDDGPYVVRGGITIVDGEGNPFEVKESVALCRCGQSANKPFCDGTHNKVGFESAPRAG